MTPRPLEANILMIAAAISFHRDSLAERFRRFVPHKVRFFLIPTEREDEPDSEYFRWY
jgi:hypothetical protein